MNFKLVIQYDGTDFHGWQIQENLRTVQGELTRALSSIEGTHVTVFGSGRTDAGVHAQGQVASAGINRDITPAKLRAAINGNLDRDVRVMHAEVVPDTFHARYSARSKTYVYRIINSRVISPFWVRYALQEARPLAVEQMRLAARSFVGEHDWTAYSAAQSDAEDRIRTIMTCTVNEQYNESARAPLIEITVAADGFLRYMVRSIVGTLLAAGLDKLDCEAIEPLIAAKNRANIPATAPPQGLTLLRVDY